MKSTFTRLAVSAALFGLTASFALPSLAQDVRREDSVTYFLQMDKIDADKDGMVSRKEFLDAMGKTWDMHMAEARKMAGDKPVDPKMKDKMALQQYLEFSKMFGLNIGG